MMQRSVASVAVAATVVIISALIPAPSSFAQVPEGSCSSRVSGDFDEDGESDLAVGVPGQDVDGANSAGAVHVFYGGPAGLDGARDDVITQDSGNVEDVAEAGDAFGSCLAAGDFNGDGQSDIAIGVPGENHGPRTDAGAINVIYGTPDGLDAVGPPTDDFIHQGSSGIGGALEEGDRFGSSLAVGDFDSDGNDDLAIGSPFDDVVDIVDAGAVNVIYGANGGLTAAGDRLYYQDVPNIAEKSERRDEFGASLAAGDLNGDGESDLAIGVVGESVGAKRKAGMVQLIYANTGGLATNDVLWHQDRAGVAADGASELDRFGTAVAIGDFDGDGYGDLAVGTPAEDVGGDADAGAVNVFYGSDTGINASGDRFFTQDTSAGVTGDPAEPGDAFGSSLAAADFEDDADGNDDLAVGAPGEDTVAGPDVGAVFVMYGDDPAGLDGINADRFTQDTPAAMDDLEEANDRFGASLVAGDYDSDSIADLTIGVPGEDVNGEGEAGAVHVVYGDTAGLDPAGVPPDLFLHQDSGTDDDAEDSDRFGAALG